MLRLFKTIYGEKQYEFDPRTLVYLRLQKVLDATEEERVREIEKEEAMKKVERRLESYLTLL